MTDTISPEMILPESPPAKDGIVTEIALFSPVRLYRYAFSLAGVLLIFPGRTYSPARSSEDTYFPTTSSDFFSTSAGKLYAPTSTISTSFSVISCPILTSFFMRTISVVFSFAALNSGVIAKQIISDSAMQTTPRTVLFFSNFMCFPFRIIRFRYKRTR